MIHNDVLMLGTNITTFPSIDVVGLTLNANLQRFFSVVVDVDVDDVNWVKRPSPDVLKPLVQG